MADREDAPLRIIVNETLAREWFPGEDPIGARLIGAAPIPETMILEVIGVVGNVKNEGIREDVRPTMMLPYTNAAFATQWQRFMTLMVRSDEDPLALTASVRSAISAVDSRLSVSQIQTLDDVVSDQVAGPRFVTLLLGMFAGLALLLAALGIYGVISYSVAQRTQEIGVRIALGANRGNVLKLVIGQGLSLVAARIGIGIVLAFAATRALAGLLFGVSSTDPWTFLGAAVFLAGVGIMATYFPARRASNVEPVMALRHE